MPRAFFHDYKKPSCYHITISKAAEAPLFGNLVGTVERPQIWRSPLGQIIASEIFNLKVLNPALQLYQYKVMPDHVHFILNVASELDRALGKYIGQMKGRILQKFNAIGGVAPVFQPDFYDRILFPGEDLHPLYKYLRENPRRLAVRRQYPEYFHRVNHLDINGISCQAYGNFQLLSNPLKDSVVIHRADSPQILETKSNWWLYHAENKGVFISPFIVVRRRPCASNWRRSEEKLSSSLTGPSLTASSHTSTIFLSAKKGAS